MKIAAQIRNHRKYKDWSQDELAEKVFVSRQTISNWETEKSYPDLQSLFILSNLFNLTLDELVKGDIEKMKNELSNKQLNHYSVGMLVFMGLMIGSLTLVKRFGMLTLPSTVFFGFGMMFCAYKIEVIKKKLNIQTYQEIVNYMEGKEVSRDTLKHRKQRLIIENVLKIIVGFILGGALAFIALNL